MFTPAAWWTTRSPMRPAAGILDKTSPGDVPPQGRHRLKSLAQLHQAEPTNFLVVGHPPQTAQRWRQVLEPTMPPHPHHTLLHVGGKGVRRLATPASDLLAHSS